MLTPTHLFALAALLAVGYLMYANVRASPEPSRGRWKIPAGLAIAFLAFTIVAIWTGGPFGFLDELTRTWWSSQIWFDLLLAISIALCWMIPQARALGMWTGWWLVLVAASGSIGLLAMLARLWWLQERSTKPESASRSTGPTPKPAASNTAR